MRNPPYTIAELDRKPSGIFAKLENDYLAKWKGKLSVETIEMITIGKRITYEELSKTRGNSYDQKTRYPLLDNETLIKKTQHILNNCMSVASKTRYCADTTYEECLVNSLVPILMDRLEEAELNRRIVKKSLKEILKGQEWARMTYKDKLRFGMSEDQAIKSRERRYNGVFMNSISKLKDLLNIKGQDDNSTGI